MAKQHNPFMSRKLMLRILDDFSMFGSTPFYLVTTLALFFMNNIVLAKQLLFSYIAGHILILIIKSLHYKERPQKEEFTMFMEKMVASSFPSTHSLVVTLLAVHFSLAFPLPWVIGLSSLLALSVYAQRYVQKKHFIIDCFGGFILGSILAGLVYYFL